MILKKRAVTTFEDIKVDETMNIGLSATGKLFRVAGDAYTEAQPKEVALLYFNTGRKIPAEFVSVRAIVQALL